MMTMGHRKLFEQQRCQDLINAKSRLARASGGYTDGRAETFDAHSGQIFIEQTVSLKPQRWTPRLYTAERKIHKEKRGAASLQDISRREFIRYLEGLPADASEELIEVLRSVPWQIAQRIWAEADKMDLAQPLMVWCAFTAVYKGTKAITYHKTAINRPEPEDLPLYISRMTSTNLSWLVCLTITAPFKHTDIINISTLRNLVVLDVGAAHSTYAPSTTGLVTDSVIRSWGRSVAETSAFPKLQAILLREQAEVTHLSLTYLNLFPSLVLFGVKSCFRPCRTTRAMAESLGWTTSDDHGVLRAIEKDIETGYSWDCAMTSCFKHTTALLPEADAEESRTADRPMLSFRLGLTPKDILSPNALDKMTFFRARNATFEPADASSPHIPSTSLASQKISLSRSTTKMLKRKKQFDLNEVLGDMGEEFTPIAVTEPPTPAPEVMSAPSTSATFPAANAHLAQMRRSMPPPPSQPVRSTSNFDLMEMGSTNSVVGTGGATNSADQGEEAVGGGGPNSKATPEERKKTRSH